MKRRAALILGLAGIAFCAHTGVAFPAQYFVNGATGDDTNTCLQPTVGAPPLGPCKTIGQALDLAELNADPDEVLVADGIYAETVTVGDGTLLRTLDTTDPKPVISSSAIADDAVAIPGSGGSVDGFEIRSVFRPLSISGVGSVTNNDFPTTAAPTGNNDIVVFAVTGSVLIAGNSFTDDGVDSQTGVFSQATSATNLTIQNNDFDGLQIAIFLQDNDASPLIADNQITGLHEGAGAEAGAGVLVYEGSPTIRHNTIDAPAAGTTVGVNVSDTNGPVGAALSRNTITDLTLGVAVSNTSVPATLNGDVITGSSGNGLQAVDFGGGGGDVNATNVTIYDSGAGDIRLIDNVMTLDSSIVGNAIDVLGATCTISFSRGPAIGTPGDLTDCNDFQTVADPMFVTPGTNYHLLMGSPMIDAGNTLDPGVGALDIDGDPRGLSSTPGCTLMAGRRDIGADEFVPGVPAGCTPVTAAGTGAPGLASLANGSVKLKKNKVTLQITCAAGAACDGDVALQTAKPVELAVPSAVGAKKTIVRLGNASFSIPAGGIGTVSVKLSKRGRKLFKQRAKVRAQATLTTRGAATTRSATTAIRIKKKRKRS